MNPQKNQSVNQSINNYCLCLFVNQGNTTCQSYRNRQWDRQTDRQRDIQTIWQT